VVFSLGNGLLGTCLRLPKPWVLVWLNFGKFSYTLTFEYLILIEFLCD
jgi:hypothetical protein